MLYLYFKEAYRYETWQGGSFWWKDAIRKATQPVYHVYIPGRMTCGNQTGQHDASW